jgi:hypothetical protein
MSFQHLIKTTSQFYLPWNLIEADSEKSYIEFIELVAQLDMYIILRLGPYVCGEIDFGGFPGRLAKKKYPQLRTYEANYIAETDAYWANLLPEIKPYLYINNAGGTILMVQIENEFGSFGDVTTVPSDKQYLEHLKALAVQHLGTTAALFTTDGPGGLSRGGLEGVCHVGDFGPEPSAATKNNFALMKAVNAKGASPDFVSEFYTGWMSAWGADPEECLT